jgi:hypothetical protein
LTKKPVIKPLAVSAFIKNRRRLLQRYELKNPGFRLKKTDFSNRSFVIEISCRNNTYFMN